MPQLRHRVLFIKFVIKDCSQRLSELVLVAGMVLKLKLMFRRPSASILVLIVIIITARPLVTASHCQRRLRVVFAHKVSSRLRNFSRIFSYSLVYGNGNKLNLSIAGHFVPILLRILVFRFHFSFSKNQTCRVEHNLRA